MPQSFLGNVFVILGSLFWSLFPIVSLFVMQDIPPFITMGICWGIAGIFFFFLILKDNILREWKNSPYKKDMILAGIILGIFFHGLLFFATLYTTPSNIIILGMGGQVLFSFLFFHFFKKEKESPIKFLGAGIMAISLIIIFWEQILSFSFNTGDVFALLAAAIAPIGNMYQKKATKNHSGKFILFWRSLIITPFLFLIAFGNNEFDIVNTETIIQNIPLFLFIGIGIFGVSKIFWIEGIKRISIPQATAITLIDPFLTLIFAYLILSEAPSFHQYFALIPFILGGYLLVKNS